jgi:hypothetical protein
MGPASTRGHRSRPCAVSFSSQAGSRTAEASQVTGQREWGEALVRGETLVERPHACQHRRQRGPLEMPSKFLGFMVHRERGAGREVTGRRLPARRREHTNARGEEFRQAWVVMAFNPFVRLICPT